MPTDKILTRHTPGPWKVEGRMILGRAFTGSWCAIADNLHGGNPTELDANAHLLASAPDLLASLKEFVALYDGTRDMLGTSVLGKLERAEAAIAKAEGC